VVDIDNATVTAGLRPKNDDLLGVEGPDSARAFPTSAHAPSSSLTVSRAAIGFSSSFSAMFVGEIGVVRRRSGLGELVLGALSGPRPPRR